MYKIHSHIPIKSVFSSKISLRESPIHGIGMFAKEKIFMGEMICIKGGYVLKKEKLFSSAIINSYLPISDEYFIGSLALDDEEKIKLYFNHSCDPNCGVHGEIAFIAIRDILSGEELTIDYAFVDNEDYFFECHCGSPKCRSIVTGYDWKRKEIQQKYYPHFAQYLKDKINLQKE